jgi:hypothetical protein
MSERTDTKLRETKFFLQNLVRESDKESPSEPEAFLFYLNAFLTAGESVRCFLEDDYGYERQKAGGVFKFMNEQRHVVVHREGSPDVELVWVHVPVSELRNRGDHPPLWLSFLRALWNSAAGNWEKVVCVPRRG